MKNITLRYMNEKQKKIIYVVSGILCTIGLIWLSYYLYQRWSKPVLTEEQKEIISNIEKKESLQNQQIKGDIALANRR